MESRGYDGGPRAHVDIRDHIAVYVYVYVYALWPSGLWVRHSYRILLLLLLSRSHMLGAEEVHVAPAR